MRPRSSPGSPGIVAAMHQRSPHLTTTSDQTAGSRPTSRCGSLASIARPLRVRCGAITQLFDATARGSAGFQRTASGISGSPGRSDAQQLGVEHAELAREELLEQRLARARAHEVDEEALHLALALGEAHPAGKA